VSSPRPVSRRQLFTFWRRPPDPPAYLRPPGALDEQDLLSTCERCGRCVEACPRHAIVPLGDEAGAAAGTPVIRPRRAPCVVCHGIECTHVCPTGALRPLTDVLAIRMGTAVLEEARCLAHRGEACARCVEACPIPGALLRRPGDGPEVVADRCVGCGLCEHVCPAAPVAIRVAPRAG
jgi:MauM/NapG family ferredoxin protein